MCETGLKNMAGTYQNILYITTTKCKQKIFYNTIYNIVERVLNHVLIIKKYFFFIKEALTV